MALVQHTVIQNVPQEFDPYNISPDKEDRKSNSIFLDDSHGWRIQINYILVNLNVSVKKKKIKNNYFNIKKKMKLAIFNSVYFSAKLYVSTFYFR